MGAASARKLAQDGFAVAILSSSGKGEALAKELGGIGVTGSNQSVDDLKKLVDLTVENGVVSIRSSTVPAMALVLRFSILPMKTGTKASIPIS